MPAILPDIPATEALIVTLTNKVRQREKLGSVKPDRALSLAARAYAQYLAKTKAFSHTADGNQPSARASAAGYKICQVAENLALTQNEDGFATERLASDTLDGWLNSPGHRANLLAPYVTDIAVAVARVPDKEPKYVIVQMFGRPESMSTQFQVSNATKDKITYTLSGKPLTVDAGSGIRHTVCEPKTIEFRSAGKASLNAKYTAENGKVYTVLSKGGAVQVEVKTRDTVGDVSK